MTPTELLKPRYEVIADYPGSSFTIGEVVFDYKEKAKSAFDKYPHLFRPLAWWEHRKPEDMPEYVKDKSSGKVYKVADPSQNHRIWHVDGEIEHRFITRSWYTPATETEYQEYLKSKV